ncbi:Potassium channel subfamily K member 7 [Galemys pyrenaicus]|uniref:Potassium channel subfamily K member 7 n=1 Tax=Galemys pyrenaicus TaxID=202257 RepID=A0A8J6DUQ0_GALPY|nr:Potassium channel subfamily K member 7 [Galemys pyrenaicus]
MGGLRPWARCGLLLAAHLLALGLGAAVLQALERPPALRRQAQLRAQLAAFQEKYGACLAPGALEELLGTALVAQAHGVSDLGNGSEARNWDLPSALLFTASILTTTGYGHMAPLSAGGKAFCVVFAVLGLPASLVLVAILRHCLLPLFSCPCAWVAARWQLAPARAALLQAAGLGLLVVGTFVLLPAMVLWGVQGDLSLLEAVYFCFGSLSTISLGDLLPSRGRGLHPVLYHLGEFALLGESSHQEHEGKGRTGVLKNPFPPCGCVKRAVSGTKYWGEEVSTLGVGGAYRWHPSSCPGKLSSPGYLLLGLLAMLLAVETVSELPQVRAMVKFFGCSGPSSAEDQGGILSQDEVALSALPATAASQQAPAC